MLSKYYTWFNLENCCFHSILAVFSFCILIKTPFNELSSYILYLNVDNEMVVSFPVLVNIYLFLKF